MTLSTLARKPYANGSTPTTAVSQSHLEQPPRPPLAEPVSLTGLGN
jgi:hypothetical protein